MGSLIHRPLVVPSFSRPAPARRAHTVIRAEASLSVEKVVYPGTVALTAFGAVVNLVKPGLLGQYISETASMSVSDPTLRIAGAATLPLVAAAYRCYLASTRNNLGSDTYQRLTLLLAAVTAAGAALVFKSVARFGLTPFGKAFGGVHAVLSLGLLYLWYKNSSRPTYLLKDIVSTAGDVLTPPSNIASAFYAALTAAATAAAAALFYSPGVVEWGAVMTKTLLGIRMAGLAIIGYTLKNGADRNRLGRGTFKLLNEAVAVGSAIAAVTMYRSSEAITPLLGGVAAVAAMCAFLRFKPSAAASGSNSEITNVLEYEYQNIKDPMEEICSDDPNAEECKVFEN